MHTFHYSAKTRALQPCSSVLSFIFQEQENLFVSLSLERLASSLYVGYNDGCENDMSPQCSKLPVLGLSLIFGSARICPVLYDCSTQRETADRGQKDELDRQEGAGECG